jgi:hypothetical protein
LTSLTIKFPRFPNRLRKNSTLHLILGGAAVHRCDNRLVLNTALAAEGAGSRSEAIFPATS